MDGGDRGDVGVVGVDVAERGWLLCTVTVIGVSVRVAAAVCVCIGVRVVGVRVWGGGGACGGEVYLTLRDISPVFLRRIGGWLVVVCLSC